RVFDNHKGRLVERKDIPALDDSNGWWCSILPADVDNDGDTDFLLGNAGTNMQFRASKNQPVELIAGDFNQDGVVDPLVNYYIQNKSYPLATRDELLDQISSLKKKFVKYEDYADATIADIATPQQLKSAIKLSVYRLESSWLENRGEKGFLLHALPEMTQFSPVNGFVFEDLDGDRTKEIVAAGN